MMPMREGARGETRDETRSESEYVVSEKSVWVTEEARAVCVRRPGLRRAW